MITEILNYTIVKKIGEGAMGQVYLAKNKSIHQFVAIKMLHPRYSSNPALRDRFRQEAIMLSSLNHPGIVKFLNYVENESGIFLIMEYVDGMTLEDYINKKTGLIVEQKAYPMMCQILDAFAYAHKRGVIHRDIKPSNIFVNKEGNIKILDFGIAQILSESGDTGKDYSGTIEYMSPEQVRCHPLDVRSDIYSLGVVFHQMLTGRAPYDTATMSDLDIKKEIVGRPLRRMKDIYPYVSDRAQAVVDRATAKDPTQRYDSCQAIKDEIEGFGKEPVSSNTSAPVRKKKKKKSSKGWIIGVVAAVVLLAAGGAGYYYYINNSDRHYCDFIALMGQPSGIGKVSADSTTHYRITYVGGHPTRLTYVNSAGQPAEIEDSILALYKPVDAEYVYLDNGTLDYKKVYNRHGRVLYKVDYDDDLCDATVERFPVDPDSTGIIPPTHYGLKYNDKGHLIAIHYKDHNGQDCSYRGAYGQKLKYDNSGRLIEVTYIDESGQPTEDETGICVLRFEYKGPMASVKTLMFDKAGKSASPKAPKQAAPKRKPKQQKEPHPKKSNDYPQSKLPQQHYGHNHPGIDPDYGYPEQMNEK